MRRRRNPGHFGTATRAIADHYKTLEQAALILQAEHGTKHEAGQRADLCPRCKLIDRVDKPGLMNAMREAVELDYKEAGLPVPGSKKPE